MRTLRVFLSAFIALLAFGVFAMPAAQATTALSPCACSASAVGDPRTADATARCTEWCSILGNGNATVAPTDPGGNNVICQCDPGVGPPSMLPLPSGTLYSFPLTCDYACADLPGLQIDVPAPPPPPNPIIPRLTVPIPGLTFTPPNYTTGGLAVNFIAEYVNGVYRYLIGFMATVAIVMIMIGGLQYVLGASGGDVKAGKTRITNALVGLVLLLLLTVILYTVNPQLTLFEPLILKVVPTENLELSDLGEEELTGTSASAWVAPPPGTVFPSHPYLLPNNKPVNPVLEADLYAALDEFHAVSGTSAVLESGLRTATRQMELFWDNCLQNTPNRVCNPSTSSGGIGEGFVKKNAAGGWDLTDPTMTRDRFVREAAPHVVPTSTPHLSGIAIDIWCSRNKRTGYIFDTACQIQLTEALLNHNFCRLTNEAWHFEYLPHVVSASACLGKGALTPGTQVTNGSPIDFSRFSIWNADRKTPSADIACRDYDESRRICRDNLVPVPSP